MACNCKQHTVQPPKNGVKTKPKDSEKPESAPKNNNDLIYKFYGL